jgi:hypothetical protein
MPANPQRGEATLDIGGRERVLSFDYNTIARIEEEADMSFLVDEDDDAGRKALEKKFSRVSFIRVAVAAALTSERRQVSPDQVGRWLSSEPGKIAEATQALTLAMRRFFDSMRAMRTGEEVAEQTTKETETTAGAPAASTGPT